MSGLFALNVSRTLPEPTMQITLRNWFPTNKIIYRDSYDKIYTTKSICRYDNVCHVFISCPIQSSSGINGAWAKHKDKISSKIFIRAIVIHSSSSRMSAVHNSPNLSYLVFNFIQVICCSFKCL